MNHDRDSIRTSIASMRRLIRRDYDLPPDKQRTSDDFFSRMDALNEAGELSQQMLDTLFIALMTDNRFGRYLRPDNDPHYTLYP